MTNSICCVFKLLRKRDLRSTCCYYYEVLLALFPQTTTFFRSFLLILFLLPELMIKLLEIQCLTLLIILSTIIAEKYTLE